MAGTRGEPATGHWRHLALCRDEDPELFFPIGTGGPAQAQITAAKAVCGGCPVSLRCLTWAIDTGEDVGVWGGLDAAQRRTLRTGMSRSRPRSATRAPAPGRRS